MAIQADAEYCRCSVLTVQPRSSSSLPTIPIRPERTHRWSRSACIGPPNDFEFTTKRGSSSTGQYQLLTSTISQKRLLVSAKIPDQFRDVDSTPTSGWSN